MSAPDILTVSSEFPDSEIFESGSVSNVYWRRIFMDEIRSHPNFVHLPLLKGSVSLDRFHLIREDLPEWDMIHSGRVTTSKANVCLGFMENYSKKSIGILDSYEGISHAELSAIIKAPRLTEVVMSDEIHKLSPSCNWKPTEEPSFISYNYTATSGPPLGRVKGLEIETSKLDVSQLRRLWGSIQEPIGILAAINFASLYGGIVEEVGLHTFRFCGENDLCGATPDCLVRWPDGSFEPVEVKSSCPFFTFMNGRGSRKKHKFCVKNVCVKTKVLAYHMAQLQWHMMATKAQSILLINVSPTDGAAIIRVFKNPRWCELAEIYVRKYVDAVRNDTKLEPNFFFDETEHQELRNLTKTMSVSGYEVIAILKQPGVQRGSRAPFLFVDRNQETIWPLKNHMQIKCIVNRMIQRPAKDVFVIQEDLKENNKEEKEVHCIEVSQ